MPGVIFPSWPILTWVKTGGTELYLFSFPCLELVGKLISLAGTFVMAYGLFSAMLSATKDSRQLRRKDAQTQPQLDMQLPSGALPEPMLPVTERTTRLMETIDARLSEGKPRDESSV
jgi:hypothetical protein